MTELTVSGITAADFDKVRLQNWLGKTSPELFREYLLPSSEVRRTLLLDRFRILFNKTGSEIRLCKRGREYLAVIGLERMEWDTRHFGIECGRLSPYCISGDASCPEQSEIHNLMLGIGIEWARRNKIKVLQRRLLSSRLHEINVLEDLGFHLADNVVTLAAPLRNMLSTPSKKEGDLTFRSPAKRDLDALVSMTRGAFPYSRFVNDKVLAKNLGDDLYLKWLGRLFAEATESTAAKSADQGIIVASVKDRIAGYVVYQYDRDLARVIERCIGTIELIVVDPAFQGKGIGQGLLRKACRTLGDFGVDLIESSTWINHRLAMASNQQAGLRVRENLFTYHLHL